MEKDAQPYTSLLRQIPHVLRARGFRLYLENGKRLIDLWLNGGAAVLGHTPANLLREIKNTASRGLYAPYPHFTESRFLKALTKLLPGRSFRLYAAPPKELTESYIQEILNKDAEKNKSYIKIWRPYTETGDTPVIIPVLPGIQTWRENLPVGLCAAAVKPENILTHLPENDMLSPVLLSAAARGVYDILASSQRGKPDLPHTFKALKKQNCRWLRNGIYLHYKETESALPQCLRAEEWSLLFNKFLEAGFLLPPLRDHPLILPAELSEGEDKKLAAALDSVLLKN
ncbi:MAG: hypothetical protein FWC17_05040 [Treponema sp.]|nr:hypothetical protein [Treponema sp.]